MTAILTDRFGRQIRYLRLSVTDRCDLRCIYCMQEKMKFLPKQELLTLEELERLCHIFIAHGVKKIRISGGEPLVRTGIMNLIASLGREIDESSDSIDQDHKSDKEEPRLQELSLTTNATLLERYAQDLVKSSVKRVNISLDSLDRERFKRISRKDKLHQCLDGIMAAKDAGLKIKINMVAMAGINDMEIRPMINWCMQQGFDLCFIEVMPMGALLSDERARAFMSLDKLQEELSQEYNLQRHNNDKADNAAIHLQTSGPAKYFNAAGSDIKIGFITPFSENFCGSCNRVRMTCTGQIYPCLGQIDKIDLREILRRPIESKEKQDQLLTQAIKKIIIRKPWGHDFTHDGTVVPRHMNVTGG